MGCLPGSKPELDTLPTGWNIRAGEILKITLSALDCDDDVVTIKGMKLPEGAKLSQTFDPESRKHVATLTWTPKAEDAGKTFDLGFQAVNLDQTGRQTEASDPRWTNVTVQATPIDVPDVDSIQALIIQKAQWLADQGELILSGLIKFDRQLSKSEREALVSNPVTLVDGATDAVLAEVFADARGKWLAKLPLAEGSVPCTVEVQFQGQTAVRSVKRAPQCK
ncbi:hypothetical protein [Methylococcus geothermalis]|uniref:Uncharacterized protein n=1 Tax=Methylococcus geothermalis TaxID=2681310 RepID=A0A858Q764_9GAMM|nr:hypothetical protein [Methylococcus geothermalis]QJD29635.1 hypothetical protein GNH96_06405 [Methylococcus geothermalis]